MLTPHLPIYPCALPSSPIHPNVRLTRRARRYTACPTRGVWGLSGGMFQRSLIPWNFLGSLAKADACFEKFYISCFRCVSFDYSRYGKTCNVSDKPMDRASEWIALYAYGAG